MAVQTLIRITLDLFGIDIGTAAAFASAGTTPRIRIADAVAVLGLATAGCLGWKFPHDALLHQHNDGMARAVALFRRT